MNCQACGQNVDKEGRLFCSPKCRDTAKYELVKCQNCNLKFEREKGVDNRWGEVFCSFDCYVKYARVVAPRMKCKVCCKNGVPLQEYGEHKVRLCPNCYSEANGEFKVHFNKMIEDILSLEKPIKKELDLSNITIIVDTREQKPWQLDDFKIENTALTTGDYQIKDMNDLVIERKGSVSELWGNLLNDKRFFREAERLKLYKYAYVICDFTFDEFLVKPYQLNGNWANTKAVLKKMCECEIKYGLRFIFAGKSAPQVVRSLIKRVLENA